MKPYLPALLLLLNGCAHEWTVSTIPGTTPTTAYVCLDLPDPAVSQAKEAVRIWSVALGKWRNLDYVVGRDAACAYTVSETTKPPLEYPNAIAYANRVGGDKVFMIRGRYENRVRDVLVHELGHIFGAQHVPGTTMNSYHSSGLYGCPDATTVAQVAAWYRLNLEMLQWCY